MSDVIPVHLDFVGHLEDFPDLIEEWPDLSIFLDGPDKPWRSAVASWLVPWRDEWDRRVAEYQGAGMPALEAEERACREVEATRSNPSPERAKCLADGRRAVKDAVERPRMVRRTKKAAPGQAEMFGGMDDEGGRSTTYGME